MNKMKKLKKGDVVRIKKDSENLVSYFDKEDLDRLFVVVGDISGYSCQIKLKRKNKVPLFSRNMWNTSLVQYELLENLVKVK